MVQNQPYNALSFVSTRLAIQTDNSIFAPEKFNLIQNVINMELKDSNKSYKAPKAQVVEVKAQSVLCSSNGYPTEFEEENDN